MVHTHDGRRRKTGGAQPGGDEGAVDLERERAAAVRGCVLGENRERKPFLGDEYN